MNIKGLTIREISEIMEKYVADYFKGSRIDNYKGDLFQENYTLEFGEIDIDLPQKHLFKDTDNINSTSGYVYLSDTSEKHIGYEYVIILLSNAEKALYLILHKEDTSEAENIILKNFIESEDIAK